MRSYTYKRKLQVAKGWWYKGRKEEYMEKARQMAGKPAVLEKNRHFGQK